MVFNKLDVQKAQMIPFLQFFFLKMKFGFTSGPKLFIEMFQFAGLKTTQNSDIAQYIRTSTVLVKRSSLRI